MEDNKAKAEKLIEAMAKERGYLQEEWKFVAMNDPDFMEAYNKLYRSVFNAGKALSLVEREMIACAILCYRGRTNGVKAHMVRAIKHGATKQHLLEAVQTCLLPGGTIAFRTGIEALMLALKECEEKGIEMN